MPCGLRGRGLFLAGYCLTSRHACEDRAASAGGACQRVLDTSVVRGFRTVGQGYSESRAASDTPPERIPFRTVGRLLEKGELVRAPDPSSAYPRWCRNPQVLASAVTEAHHGSKPSTTERVVSKATRVLRDMSGQRGGQASKLALQLGRLLARSLACSLHVAVSGRERGRTLHVPGD